MSGDPMTGTEEVCLTFTQGPICGLGNAGINTTHALWDSILATELFPPNAGPSGANYVLTLKKGVNHANEVRATEIELTEALVMLAAAWPFAGGSYLTIETRNINLFATIREQRRLPGAANARARLPYKNRDFA
jgi:hypothetical protein